MNIGEEMDGFFTRYSPEQRKQVEADPFYQAAANRGDVVKAQEIACELLSGSVSTPKEGRELRRTNEIFSNF